MTATVSPAGATASYQWQLANGGEYAPIDGAAESTFVLTSEQVGKTVRCECTGTGNYTGTVQSDPTEVVTAPPVAVTGVSISGTPQVNQTLTANVEPGGATVAYEWQQSDAADGVFSAISEATNSTLVLLPILATKYIKVKVTGTGSYSGTATSEAVGPVTDAQGPLAVVGTAIVGSSVVSSEASTESVASKRSKKAGG